MDNIRNNFQLNILHWNSQSSKPKLISLELLLNKENIHIQARDFPEHKRIQRFQKGSRRRIWRCSYYNPQISKSSYLSDISEKFRYRNGPSKTFKLW